MQNLLLQGIVQPFSIVFLLLLSIGGLGTATCQAQTRAYVTNPGSNTASVIDTSTNAVSATIPLGNYPQGVAFTPDGTRVYVTNNSSFNVSAIDTASNVVVATIPVGANPDAVAITPDGTRAYVSNFNGGVSVIDTGSNTVIATITVGMSPEGIAITPDGTRARGCLSIRNGIRRRCRNQHRNFDDSG